MILPEGQKASDYPKIKLVRKAVSRRNVCKAESLLAVATDTELACHGVPVIGLSDYEEAARIILDFIEKKNRTDK